MTSKVLTDRLEYLGLGVSRVHGVYEKPKEVTRLGIVIGLRQAAVIIVQSSPYVTAVMRLQRRHAVEQELVTLGWSENVSHLVWFKTWCFGW